MLREQQVLISLIKKLFKRKINIQKGEDVKEKTEYCSREIMQGRCCAWKDQCIFVHSVKEMMPKVLDIQRYKQVKCNRYDLQGCKYGRRCLYLHDETKYNICRGITLLISDRARISRILCQQSTRNTVSVFTLPLVYHGDDADTIKMCKAIEKFVAKASPSGLTKTPEKKFNPAAMADKLKSKSKKRRKSNRKSEKSSSKSVSRDSFEETEKYIVFSDDEDFEDSTISCYWREQVIKDTSRSLESPFRRRNLSPLSEIELDMRLGNYFYNSFSSDLLESPYKTTDLLLDSPLKRSRRRDNSSEKSAKKSCEKSCCSDSLFSFSDCSKKLNDLTSDHWSHSSVAESSDASSTSSTVKSELKSLTDFFQSRKLL